MLDETQMAESDKKEIYNRIMEQQVATLKYIIYKIFKIFSAIIC